VTVFPTLANVKKCLSQREISRWKSVMILYYEAFFQVGSEAEGRTRGYHDLCRGMSSVLLHVLTYFISQGSVVTPAGLKTNSSKLIFVKNLKTCTAVLLYAGYSKAKAKEPYTNNDHDTSQNNAVNLAR
jgi:hypothetical protein